MARLRAVLLDTTLATTLALAPGCSLESPPRCSTAAQCDYGQPCADGRCAAPRACGCSSDEACHVEEDFGDCVRSNGTCDTHQDCARGAVCRDGWCSYRHARTPDTPRRAFDQEVFGFAEQQGPVGKVFDVDDRLFLSWSPPEWLDADRTTVAIFTEPPVVAGDRIVNADRAMRDSLTFEGSGSFQVRIREIQGRSLGEPLDAGLYYWVVWQHQDGVIVAFSDLEFFQVQESTTRLRLPGATCMRDDECWEENDQPVACIERTCALVCAGWHGDCASGTCEVGPGGPPWFCAPQ